MKPLTCVLLMAIFCWLGSSLYANNLSITGLSVSQNSSTGGTVTFTITWNNCWNLSTGTAPNNWDAAWVFVKFRSCAASPAVPFTQGTLGTYSQHVIPSTLQAMTSLPQSSYYTAGGSTVITSGSLDDPNGIMLSPTTAGTQTSVTGSVTLYVTNLPANTIAITADVIGIEMVYVPQGPFNLGDGSTNGSYYHFCTSASSSSPALIGANYETAAQTFYYMSNGTSTPASYAASVPAAFPKGYYAFYCMKYEITEDLYSSFLNTIGSSGAQNRWLGNSGTNRNQVSQTNSSTFATARPYRAQNFMSFADWEAVLDWACLRPMSELEFEKACRGGSSTTANGAMNNEFPWQSTSITTPTTTGPSFSGAETGTETIVGGNNCNANLNWNFSNGDGGQGPVRAGIFATSSTGQQTAGSTYYGIMEMGGNVREYVIELSSNVAADTFTRNVGNGILISTPGTPLAGTVIGDEFVSTWPSPTTATPAATGFSSVIGQRGGDFYSGPNEGSYANLSINSYYDPIQTSSRYMCYYNTNYNNSCIYQTYTGVGRYNGTGGRGVR